MPVHHSALHRLLQSRATPRARAPRIALLAVLLALSCGPGPSVPLGTAAAGPVLLDREYVLVSEPVAAGIMEVNFLSPRAGASVTVFFTARGGAVRWDVHGHDGGLTVYDQGEDAGGEVRFSPPGAGLFSFLAQHAGAPGTAVRLRVTLRGEATLHSVYP